MSFFRLLTYLILFLFCADTFCARVTSRSLTKEQITEYRKQIITGQFTYGDVTEQGIFTDVVKGADSVGKFIQYVTDSIEAKKAFVVYRHAQTPKSNYINPSHSTTEITQEGRIYSQLFGIVFSLVAQENSSVFFLTGDTKRNVLTQSNVVTGFTEGKNNIQQLIHSGINELKLGKYERMDKKEVLNDGEFLETVSSLGLLPGAEKSISQSFVEFCSTISKCAPNENSEKFIQCVCSNSALMAAMERFASGSDAINIPDNLAFFVLVPDYEKNIIYMCSPKLAAKILPDLKPEVDDGFANMFQERVSNLLRIKKDAELVKKIYEEMFTQNDGKIFNLDGNYITFGKKLSEDTLIGIQGIMDSIAQNQ